MKKKQTVKPKAQKVRTRGLGGEVYFTGRLEGGTQGKHTYLVVRSKDGAWLDMLEGQKLYRLAKAIVRRFEAAAQ